ncbi:MAG: acylphosphatase [Merismopedia sp. SIO2A8]|nr:acylphosphatase [Symploca sp. SIO2B6]NET47880.1 acylphosphatase [Merismopedia sp. SIO2A8]
MSTTSNPVSVHVFVSGKVQGVGYRASTCDAATLLKITGWVRNLRDGRVEAIFEGRSANVQEMVQWCHQGPPTAVVKQVNVTYQGVEGFQHFDMRRTQ